ncbi:polycystic kidney disease 1-like 2-like, partial [Brachionus plicatilis]
MKLSSFGGFYINKNADITLLKQYKLLKQYAWSFEKRNLELFNLNLNLNFILFKFESKISAAITTLDLKKSNLNYVRVWHDNSGEGNKASWYLKYILIRDLQTDK